MVAPLRWAATSRRLFVRKAALGCLSAPPASLAPRQRSPLRLDDMSVSSTSTMPLNRRVGFLAARRKRCRQRNAVLTAHPAPLGRRPASPWLQRLTKIKPAFLLAQSGQRRSGQRVEASAAILAAETAQAVGSAPAHRHTAAVRTAPRLAQALLDRRRHRRSGLPAGQHRLELLALLRRQTVDLRQPRSKHPLIHRNPSSRSNQDVDDRVRAVFSGLRLQRVDRRLAFGFPSPPCRLRASASSL